VPTSLQVVLEKQSEILWPQAHCFGHDIHATALNMSTLRMRFKQKDWISFKRSQQWLLQRKYQCDF